MKIKICGVSTLEDCLNAVDAGADMLGFNFYPPSKRYLAPETCRQITDGLEAHGVSVVTVGVFVNASLAEIQAILSLCRLDLAQLSGDEPPEILQVLGSRGIKALRPVDQWALERDLNRFPRRTEAPLWLLDTYHPGEFGGTGQAADWGLAADLASQAPILLAGGLTPANVAAAVSQVRPWGVDVASGVESQPGVKDTLKMIHFVKAARQAWEEHIR